MTSGGFAAPADIDSGEGRCDGGDDREEEVLRRIKAGVGGGDLSVSRVRVDLGITAFDLGNGWLVGCYIWGVNILVILRILSILTILNFFFWSVLSILSILSILHVLSASTVFDVLNDC